MFESVILCGGKGTRLESVSKGKPKCLMPIHGVPFLFHLIDQLVEKGVERIVLCTGYGHQTVQDVIGTSYMNTEIAYSIENRPLGTAGAVANARSVIKSEWFLLLNGDSYCPFPLNFLAEKTKPFLFAHAVENASRFGEVKLDASNHVVEFTEKSKVARSGLINAGIYWLSKSHFSNFPEGCSVSLEHEILPTLKGKIKAVLCNSGFIDIGTPKSLAHAPNLIKVSKRIATNLTAKTKRNETPQVNFT